MKTKLFSTIRLLAAVILLTCLATSCQRDRDLGTITGKVIDFDSTRPLAGVVVTIANTTFTSITDAGGNYEIPYAPGEFSVIYAKEDYFSQSWSHKRTTPVDHPAIEVVLKCRIDPSMR